jgi:cytochrome c556
MARVTTVVALVTVSVAVFAPRAARADDQDVIDYRQHSMIAMQEQLEAVKQIVDKKAPPEGLATHLEIISVIAATAKKAFEPKLVGGGSKPGVWTQWSDFSKRLDELTANMSGLAKIAASGGVAAVAPKLDAAFTCKSCHDVYMKPSDKPVPATLPPSANQDVIDYRQHIMKTMNEETAALGEIVSMAIPDDELVAHIHAIALTASLAPRAFEPKVPGGEAKPEVWTNWADFSKRLNEFVSKVGASDKRAHEVSKEAVTGDILDSLNCKGCHDTYRKEKK